MGAVTTAVIGLAGAGLSFAQARKLANDNKQANRDAANQMAELKRKANINVMDELNISNDLYKQELENNLQVSADLINAAREGGGREVAASAGRIGAMQTDRAEKSRLSQQQELSALEAIQTQEQADINQQLLAIDTAAIQDKAARNAQSRAAQAQQIQSGISSLGSALTSISANSDLNSLSKDDKALKKLYKDNKLKLDAQGISEIDFYKNPKLLENLNAQAAGITKYGSLAGLAQAQDNNSNPVGTIEPVYDDFSQTTTGQLNQRADEFTQGVLNESTDNRSQADIDLDNYMNSFPQAPSITGDGSFNPYNIVSQDRLFVNNNRIQMPNRVGFNSNPQSIFEKYGLTLNR